MHCSEVTADFEFNLPVRFDTDHMAVTNRELQVASLAADPDRRAQGLSLDDVQRLLPAHNLRV